MSSRRKVPVTSPMPRSRSARRGSLAGDPEHRSAESEPATAPREGAAAGRLRHAEQSRDRALGVSEAVQAREPGALVAVEDLRPPEAHPRAASDHFNMPAQTRNSTPARPPLPVGPVRCGDRTPRDDPHPPPRLRDGRAGGGHGHAHRGRPHGAHSSVRTIVEVCQHVSDERKRQVVESIARSLAGILPTP